MSKLYLLTYDGMVPPREQLLRWLDGQPRITNWHASPIHNLLALVWDGPLIELRDLLHDQTGMNAFVLVEASTEKFGVEQTGWLAKATVDFLMGLHAQGQSSAKQTLSVQR